MNRPKRGERGAPAPSPAARQTFDARALLRNFSGFDLGSERMTSIHLSDRNAGLDTNGYYRSVTTITFR
jgi:hypothetical protein